MSLAMSRVTATWKSPLLSRRQFSSSSSRKIPTSSSTGSSTLPISSSPSSHIDNRAHVNHSSRDENNFYQRDRYGVVHYSSRSSGTSRPLPDGPGPLPNKFKLDDRVKYVTNRSSGCSSQKNSSANFASSSKYKHTGRKISDDSGYGSSGSLKGRTEKYCGTALSSGRRSKSFSNLDTSFSELSVSDHSEKNPYNRSNSYQSTFPLGQGLSSRTRTLADVSRASEKTSMHLKTNTRAEFNYREPYYSDNRINQRIYLPSPSSTSSRTGSHVNEYHTTEDSRKELANSASSKIRSRSDSLPSSSPSSCGSSDGLVGLRNLGNTCFMNSILQCLSNTFLLTESLLKGTHMMNINSKSSMKGKLIHAYAELIKSMWKQGSEDSVSPMSFKTQIQRFAPRFMGYSQQDAQEFLRFLLEGLHDDLNKVQQKSKYSSGELCDSLSDSQKAEKSWKLYLGRDDSLVTDMFVGQLKSTLKCCVCDHKSVTFDPFWDLSLPVPRKSSGSYSSSSSWSARNGSYSDSGEISLVDCLRHFTKEEVLDHDERPILDSILASEGHHKDYLRVITCEKCKTKRRSTKKFSIQRFPKVLVLHLKRFSGFGFRSKLQTNVDFPLTDLNLSEFAADCKAGHSPIYRLRSVSNHSGTTYGGHYTAYCSHPISGKWHCFNDSRVDALLPSRVKGSNAYILFYEKQSQV